MKCTGACIEERSHDLARVCCARTTLLKWPEQQRTGIYRVIRAQLGEEHEIECIRAVEAAA